MAALFQRASLTPSRYLFLTEIVDDLKNCVERLLLGRMPTTCPMSPKIRDQQQKRPLRAFS
ncbi:hypothetical protein BCEN4_850006 [Burkholderia cenocepacia]|nr:hypothetical protein BCEN4_850006 [Burkholderia cenocepacia]